MSNTKLAGFYNEWPSLGVKLSRQWQAIRENTQKTAPLVRAAYVDPQPVSANAPGEHDLSGWAVGERDFRNKFRVWYDKVSDRLSIQYNSGTEAVEVWNDYLSVRDVDGRVTIHGYGGLDASVGGFYAPLSRNLAVSATFSPPSTEWQWTHSLNAKPILWNTFNLEDKSIIPISVDISNPNIAYFYFSQPYAGRAIAGAEHLRGSGIRITDGTNNYTNSTILSFNNSQFYLTHGLEGYPTVNLQPGGSGVTDHGALTGLSDDDHSQYLLASDATSRAAFAANWTDLTDGGETSLHSHAGGGAANPGFYGVNFRETDGSPSFRNDTIYFDSTSFYLHPNSVGKPVLSFRGSSGAGVSDHGALTGLADDDHPQYSLADGTRAFTGTVGGVTPTADAHLVTKAYVDTRFADFYRNAISPGTIDHGALTGLSDDDHPQYLLRSQAAPGFYGVNFRETDGNPPGFRNDTIYFNSDSFYLTSNSVGKPIVNLRGVTGSGGVTDHGALTGLTDDDHSQYLLASDATNRATFAANWTDLTDGGETSLHSHAGGGASSPGFYGVHFRETDGNPPGFRNDTIYFNSNDFYLSPNSVGKPVLNFRGQTRSAYSNTYNSAFEWQVDHNLATTAIVWGTYNTRYEAIIPYKVDVSNPNTAYFYYGVQTAGTAVVLAGGGVTDHGALTGLSDDDHPQYSLADGTRAFTGVVSGVTPTTAANLATKGYVDAVTGPGFYGISFRESDGNPPAFRNDTVIFDSDYFYLQTNSAGKPIVSLRPPTGSGGVTAHNALTGLSADDHTQYLLASDATNRATFAANWTDLTDGGETSLHSHATGAANPGFYGVHFRETDGNPPGFRNDTIFFNSDSFYLTSNSVGKPIVNFRGITGGGGVTDHGALTGLSDDDHSQYLLASQATDRDTFTINWTDLTDGGVTSLHSHAGGGAGDGGFYGIFVRESDGNPPTFRNDTLTFDSDFFYLTGSGAGNKPLVSLRNPSSRALNTVDTTRTIVSNTVDSLPIFSCVIPAGTLSPTRRLAGRVAGLYSNDSGSVRTFSLTVIYGATTIYEETSITIADGGATRFPITINFEIFNTGEATDNILMSGNVSLAATDTAINGYGGLASIARLANPIMGIGTEGAGDKTLVIKLAHNLASTVVIYEKIYSWVRVE